MIDSTFYTKITIVIKRSGWCFVIVVVVVFVLVFVEKPIKYNKYMDS